MAQNGLTKLILSYTTRLRLALIRQEEPTGIVFWAASIGFLGALTSVAFREGIRLFELAFTGHTGSLVLTATLIPWWQRILVPVAGGLAAGLVMHFGARALQARGAEVPIPVDVVTAKAFAADAPATVKAATEVADETT